MKAESNSIRYSYEYPKGKLFVTGDIIPDAFVDTPTKLGLIKGMSDRQVNDICFEGLNPTPKKVSSIKKKVSKKKVSKKKANSLSK